MSKALALIVLLVPSFASAQTTAAGSMPGSFRVTDSGAAEYRIPIQVPPGVAGMEPKLALVYNSQAGNGLLGLGWSLEGLSSITRCPRTTAQDGVRGAVNYDSNDRFCLDGQRLMAITGLYGADGTEYRTERESFSKVISYGTAGNGPAWFKVWTKSGQIMEYGSTADSRIEAQGKTTVRVWAVNKVSDTKGNYFAVSYTEDSINGAFYADRIDYTGNGAQGPGRSVQFQYETRPDIAPLYEAGSLMRSTQRLIHIKTFDGNPVSGTMLRDYRPAYDSNGAGNRSRLIGMQECGSGGNCLPTTTFGWQSNGSYSPANLRSAQNFLGHPYGVPGWVVTGDFNGDGRQDLAIFNSSADRWYTIGLSNGDGTFTKTAQGQSFLGFPYGSPQGTATIAAFDYDGDGKQDLLFVNSSGDGWYTIARSNGDGTFTNVSMSQYFLGHPYGVPGWVVTGDFNGDGRQDVAIFNSSADRWYTIGLSNGDGTFTKTAQGQGFLGFPYGSPQGTATIAAFDYDGDGKQDLLFVNSSGDGWYTIARSNGDGTFTNVSMSQYFLGHPYGVPGWVVTGDFNGDGRQDVAIFNSSADRWYTIGLSNGDGTFTKTAQGQGFLGFPYGSPQSTFPIIAADFDQDGRTDLAFFNSSSDRWYMFALSNGNGTFRSIASGQTFIGFPYGSPQATAAITPIDSNGDGRPELLFFNSSNDGWYELAQIYTASAPDQLASISNSMGATTTITCKPLTDSTVYAKDTGSYASSYPVLDMQIPFYVVSSVSSSNGVGATLTNNYKYGGLKSDFTRGPLGFRWLSATQVDTGLVTRSEYRQDWPYTGVPSQLTKTQSSNAMLYQLTNTLSCTNGAGAACTVAAGRRYFPFISQAVETGNDLNGAALPTVTTSTAYDGYGNATSVSVTTGDGYSKSTTNTFANDPVSWQLGRLTRSTVQSVAP